MGPPSKREVIKPKPLKLKLKSKAKKLKVPSGQWIGKDGEGEDLLNLYKSGAGGSKR